MEDRKRDRYLKEFGCVGWGPLGGWRPKKTILAEERLDKLAFDLGFNSW